MFRITGCCCDAHNAIDSVEFARFAIVLHLHFCIDPIAIVDNLARDTVTISRRFPGIIAQA